MTRREAIDQDEHEAVWALLPWRATDALDSEDDARVSRHLETCADCRAELAAQSRMRTLIREDPLTKAPAGGFAALKAQIETEATPASQPRQQPGLLHRLGEMLTDLMTPKALPAFGAAMAAVLVIVVVTTGGPEGDFETLTGGEVVIDGPSLRFEAAPDATAEEIAAALARHGLPAPTGPGDSGLYAVATPAEGDPDAIAAALMEEPTILFAAPAQ